MEFLIPFKYFIFIFFFILKLSKEEDKLRWAFEIFRHGARSPYSGMTEDFVDCFGQQWDGLKELTGVGLRQHFLVGYRNRIRYMKEKKLLSYTYDPREVYLISTDSNRTIMSANAQVQGLYLPGTGPTLFENQTDIAIPPVEEENIKEAKKELDDEDYTVLPHKMNIMPIHNFFTKDHFIQLQDKKVCPNSKDIYIKNQERDEVTNFLKEMKQKYGKKIAKISKESEDALMNYTKAYYIFDTFISQYTEGLPIFYNNLEALNITEEELLNDSFKFFEHDLIGNGINHDEELCLHSMSPIFDRLINWTDLKIQKDKEDLEDYVGYDLPKLVMFSAHDSTCGAFMGFMKAVFGTKIVYPKFATNINLELYKKDDGFYYIQYYINDEFMAEFKYEDFVKKIRSKSKSTEEINKFCGFEKKEKKKEKENNDVYLIADIALSIISVVLIILIFITIKKKKANSSAIDVENAEPLNKFNENDN